MTDINASGMSGDWNTASTWSPAQVPVAGDDVTIANAGTTDIDVSSADSVAARSLVLDNAAADLVVDGTLSVANRIALEAGTLTLGGTLADATVAAAGGSFGFGDAGSASGTLDAVTWQGTLDVGGLGTAVIEGGLVAEGSGGSGPGIITIDGPDAELLFNDAADTLDNATVTIGGDGALDTLAAAGTLTLGAGAVVQTASANDVDTLGGAGSITNDGTILATSAAGELDIATTNFTNNGTISVSGGESLAIEPFGSFDNAAGGTITVGSGSTAYVEFLDSFTNEGAISVAAGGTLALDTAASALDIMQASSGTLDVAGVFDGGGQTLTIAPDTAFGTLTLGGTLADATVAAAGGSFGFGDAGSASGTLDAVTWQGTLDVGGLGTAVIEGGLVAEGSGGSGPGIITIDGPDAELLFNDAADTLDNATVTIGGDGALDTLAAAGTLTLGAGAVVQTASANDVDTLGGAGSITNDGTILATSAAGELDIATTNFTNNGTISVSGGESLAIEPFGSFDNAAGGTITVGSGSTAYVEFLDSFTNEGAISVAAGTLDVSASFNSGSGIFQISSGGVAEFDQSVAANVTVSFLDGQGTLNLTDPGAFLGGVSGLQFGDEIDVAGVAGDTHNFANGVLTFASGGTMVASVKVAGNLSADDFTYQADGSGGIDVGVACYCPGTLIRTVAGDRPVEALVIGDRVITVGGTAEPIRWLGRRSYAGRFLAEQAHLLPVRIRAGALADGLPQRDLLVSPRHAMFLDGVLVPANALLNGTSIVRETAIDQVDYIHIELANHDLIWAEGAPSETFVDDDSRNMFHNVAEYHALYPNAEATAACYCAPRAEDGYLLEAIRERIEARAAAVQLDARFGRLRGFVDEVSYHEVSGWAQDEAYPEAPVCLDVLVDGEVVAQARANRYRTDLAKAGLGSGRHAFRVVLPIPLPLGIWHRVEVRRSADLATLPHSSNPALQRSAA